MFLLNCSIQTPQTNFSKNLYIIGSSILVEIYKWVKSYIE
jgi:hypothetical protein